MGEQWMDYLNHKGIRYHIRIRNNFKVYLPRKQKQVPAWHLFNNLKVGQMRHYEHIVKVNGQLCYLSGNKSVIEEKQEYLILISYNKPDEALEYSRIR